VGSGEWGVGSGEWGVGSGEQKRKLEIENLVLITNYELRITNYFKRLSFPTPHSFQDKTMFLVPKNFWIIHVILLLSVFCSDATNTPLSVNVSSINLV
ncbi:MAG: hypothetical protein V7K27_09280, partial [Nostoc sp.]|uniref:hypothetical protein n=1 Tax=Nostoc sp. TaxID=1180 RepID=UPI002FFC9CFC